MRILFMVSIILFYLGCAQKPQFIPFKAYDGQVIPREQLSFISANSSVNFKYNIKVVKIDGILVNSNQNTKISAIHVRPGIHFLNVEFQETFPENNTVNVEFHEQNGPYNADEPIYLGSMKLITIAGHSYIIRPFIHKIKNNWVTFDCVDMGLNYPDDCLIQITNERPSTCKP